MRCATKFLLVLTSASGSALVARAGEPARKPVDLLTGQAASGALPGWKSFHEDPDATTGDVWRLSDDGVLICKGTPKGYLYTEKRYTDFVLTLEWRRPADKKPGPGGVLVRMTGKHKIWPKSLEAQLNAGAVGDFWGLDGYPLDGPSERRKRLEHKQFGKLTHLKTLSAKEKPAGEWNRYEIIAQGDTVTLRINGKQVNRATGCTKTAGRICLTAEGNEIHFRNVCLINTAE